MAFRNYSSGLDVCTHCNEIRDMGDMAIITEMKGPMQMEHRLCKKCWTRYARVTYPRDLKHIWEAELTSTEKEAESEDD